MADTETNVPEAAADDWTDQVTQQFVGLVDNVRSKTTGPLITVARGAVFGLLAAIVGLLLVVLLIIALVRVLDLLPGGVWLPYLILGAVFTIGGALLWRMRTP